MSEPTPIAEQVRLMTKALAAYQAIAAAFPDASLRPSTPEGYDNAFRSDEAERTGALTESENNGTTIRFFKNFGDDEVPIKLYGSKSISVKALQDWQMAHPESSYRDALEAVKNAG